jgi:hypothetical protein
MRRNRHPRTSRRARARAEQRLTTLGFGPAQVPDATVRPRHVRRRRVVLPRQLLDRVVAAVSGLRLRVVPSRRAVAGVAMAVLLSAGFTGWRVLAARARADPVPATALASAAAPLVATSGRTVASSSRGRPGRSSSWMWSVGCATPAWCGCPPDRGRRRGACRRRTGTGTDLTGTTFTSGVRGGALT